MTLPCPDLAVRGVIGGRCALLRADVSGGGRRVCLVLFVCRRGRGSERAAVAWRGGERGCPEEDGLDAQRGAAGVECETAGGVQPAAQGLVFADAELTV